MLYRPLALRIGWLKGDSTPGVTDANIIRPTDRIRNPVFRSFLGSILGLPPSATRFAFFSSRWRKRSRSAAFMTQLLDSTFAMLRTPRIIGSVSVGSGCDNVVSVKSDSESNGVGSSESLPRVIVVITKNGNCESGGAMMDGRGRQLCSLNNCFLRAASYDRYLVLWKILDGCWRTISIHRFAWNSWRYFFSPRIPACFISSKTCVETSRLRLCISGRTTSSILRARRLPYS